MSFDTTILKELKSVRADFKATVIAAELVDNGLQPDDIFFRNISSFRRFVSRDVAKVVVEDHESGGAQLVFEVNREGLYDMLPEGITHATASSKTDKPPAEVFTQRRKEERAARNFFSPLENEFLHRYLQLEGIERDMSNDRNYGRNRDVFETFFGDSAGLTDENVLVLLYILPLAERIRNDVNLIGLVLTKVFDRRMSVVCRPGLQRLELSGEAYCTLGRPRLGVNAVVGNSVNVFACRYVISVHDILPGLFRDFSPGGGAHNMLLILSRYFFSAEAEVDIELYVSNDQRYAFLPKGDELCFLGFNSYI